MKFWGDLYLPAADTTFFIKRLLAQVPAQVSFYDSPAIPPPGT